MARSSASEDAAAITIERKSRVRAGSTMFAFSSPTLPSRLFPVNHDFPDYPRYFRTFRRAPVAPHPCRRFSSAPSQTKPAGKGAGATPSLRIPRPLRRRRVRPRIRLRIRISRRQIRITRARRFRRRRRCHRLFRPRPRIARLLRPRLPRNKRIKQLSNSDFAVKVNGKSPVKFTPSVKARGLSQQSGEYLRPLQEIEVHS